VEPASNSAIRANRLSADGGQDEPGTHHAAALSCWRRQNESAAANPYWINARTPAFARAKAREGMKIV
jgi:hypothetical protein